MPGMVSEVSATLVETTTRRVPAGGGWNTCICFSLESRAYRGTTCIGAAEPFRCYEKKTTRGRTITLVNVDPQLLVNGRCVVAIESFVIRVHAIHISINVEGEVVAILLHIS